MFIYVFQNCNSQKSKKCTECGCLKCGGKSPYSKMILCKKCEHVTHFDCLPESKTEIPEGTLKKAKKSYFVPNGAWSCPNCRPHHKEVQADFQNDFGGNFEFSCHFENSGKFRILTLKVFQFRSNLNICVKLLQYKFLVEKLRKRDFTQFIGCGTKLKLPRLNQLYIPI